MLRKFISKVFRRKSAAPPDDPPKQAVRRKRHAPVIQGPAEHGIPGLVNLFGIESPGLTASLAIADQVAETLQRG